MKVFIYGYDVREENVEYIHVLFDELKKANIGYSVYSEFISAYAALTGETIEAKEIKDHKELSIENPDVAITLGGDGTILNATTIVRELNIPLLGINLGRMGFLASTEKIFIIEAIQLLKSGKYNTRQRSMLELESKPKIFGDAPIALNDFTLHKRDTSSMVTIHTYINGKFLNSYWADGLIVATPTGSTGYSLSCGGPIILPTSNNFVITPVAPHNLNVRPVVIPDTDEISLKIEGRSENFLCTLDSRFETVTSEHHLVLRKCKFGTNLIKLEGSSFFQTIREKLTWGKDTRN